MVLDGTCPSVGIGGHASHGGYGFTSRAWGLLCDRVTEHEVVLADGAITRASDSTNEGLFWALKGAGPSFGIITVRLLFLLVQASIPFLHTSKD